ncbi:unnamed protein product, partial [Discosporangium mesarthrocarpum]
MGGLLVPSLPPVSSHKMHPSSLLGGYGLYQSELVIVITALSLPFPHQYIFFYEGSTGPPPRALRCSFGRASGEGGTFCYVFGGSDGGEFSNDLWCLDVNQRLWCVVHAGGGGAAAPSPRGNHALCTVGSALVVHGGESPTGDLMGDLWTFDTVTCSWSEVTCESNGPQPCPRSSHCLAYVEGAEGMCTGALVVFGGQGHYGGIGTGLDPVPLNDLWVFSPTSTALRTMPGNSGSLSLWRWSFISLDGIGPSPRSLGALTAAGRRGGGGTHGAGAPISGADLYLFGGYGLAEGHSAGTEAGTDLEEEQEGQIVLAYLDDLWALDLDLGGNAAEKRVGMPAGGSGGRYLGWVDERGMGYEGESPVEGRNGHSLVVCGGRGNPGRLVLFGGFVGDGFDARVYVTE